jgi:hypothetical protein
MIIYFVVGVLLIVVLAIFYYAYRVTDKLYDHIDDDKLNTLN